MKPGGQVDTATRRAAAELSVADLLLAPDPASVRVETALRRTVLVVAIGLSCLLGYLTTYALLILAALAAAYCLARYRAVRTQFGQPAWLFLAGFGLLLVSAVATARQPLDLLYLVYFSAMLFYAPVATLFRRGANPSNSRKIADFALFGTAAGLLVSLFYTYVLGMERAGLGSTITDPIRLSNTALILGFFAMIGVPETSGRHRFVYLLGPVMALAVIFASGSRAALIAFPVLLFVASLLLVRRRWLAVLAGLTVLGGFGVVIYVADLAGARTSLSAFDVLGQLAAGNSPADLGTAIRFVLYRAGTEAFLDSIWFGHGWGQLMHAIVPYLASDELVHAQLPHLHNDALNFAVAAGLPGLAVYLLLLALPVASCLNSPRDSQYRTRLYGCSLLSISYFVLGLPDTMLSFTLHITLYVILTATLLDYCRDERG